MTIPPSDHGVREPHPLRRLLDAAARGEFPPVDGSFEVFAPARAGELAVVEFTGHAVVLAEIPHAELVALGADGFGGASHPDIKRRLAGPAGWIGTHDAVLVAHGTRGRSNASRPLTERSDLDDHPRVVRARRHRRDVHVFGDHHGFVTIGRGLVDRVEISVELFADRDHGQGRGRALIAAALDQLPPAQPVWAQVAPGNASSLRAFLSCGFAPCGAETLIDTRPQRD